MARTFTVEDARGSRRLDAEDFPLALGGPEADLQLPVDRDPADHTLAEPVAWLGLSDGDLFVQPAEVTRARIACNGSPLTASQWLHDGDELAVTVSGSSTLSALVEVSMDGDGVRFTVRERAAAARPAPPVLTPPPRAGEGRAPAVGPLIQPVEFHPQRSGGRRRRRVRPAALLTVLVLAALTAVAGFLFAARSVEVQIEPTPDLATLRGRGLTTRWTPRLGGRHLALAGTYTVHAEKEGFFPLEETVEVTAEPHQTFTFRLEPLPGLLEISTVPVRDTEVLVDGESVGTTPLEPVPIPPGEHEIRLRAPRHQDFVTTLEIEGSDVRQVLRAELVPAWAPVTFRSRPVGAEVRVDGTPVGTTPLTAELGAGVHGYELHLAGFRSHRGRIRVEAGNPLTLAVAELQPARGRLEVTSEPEGATVTVDGEYRGTTPLSLELAPGESHAVEIAKAGFDPATKTVELEPEESRELAVTLDPELGEVRIAVRPPDAELWIDGERRGNARQTLRLPTVPHRLELKKEGFEPYSATVTPRAGVVQTVEATLATVEQARQAEIRQKLISPEGHELVRIEGGRLQMGASRREPGRRANEVLREVELTRPFYLATREVSNEQFRRFQDQHLSGQVSSQNLEHPDRPAVRVAWEQAAAYCNWLSQKEGLRPAYTAGSGGTLVPVTPATDGYRLPTEAEWSWAARYPRGVGAPEETPLKYPWGDALPVAPGAGNYADRSAQEILPSVIAGYDDGYPATSPVGTYDPDARGLYDLGGNVAEWVQDVYRLRPPRIGDVERDPWPAEGGEMHVIRGASWMHSTITELRLTFRDYGAEVRPDVGFRVARYVE